MSVVSVVCCQVERGPCDGLITRPGESYRLWRVVVCDQENLYARRLAPSRELHNTNPQWVVAPAVEEEEEEKEKEEEEEGKKRSTPRYSKRLLSLTFSRHNTVYTLFFSSVRATCYAHFILLFSKAKGLPRLLKLRNQNSSDVCFRSHLCFRFSTPTETE